MEYNEKKTIEKETDWKNEFKNWIKRDFWNCMKKTLELKTVLNNIYENWIKNNFIEMKLKQKIILKCYSKQLNFKWY